VHGTHAGGDGGGRVPAEGVPHDLIGGPLGSNKTRGPFRTFHRH